MDENTRGGKEGSNNGGNIKKSNKNIIKILQDREFSSKPHRAFVTATTPHRFQNMRLSHALDTHNSKHKSPPSHILPFLMGSTKIVQIVAAKNIVFVLADSGLCAAFSSETDERICFMNLHPDDVIKRLFYNRTNDSLITVSSRSKMPVEYRSTRIEYIRRAKPDAGIHLFQSESFVVKFDDVNAKVLTYSAQDSIFKVFDLKNYTFLYLFSFSNVDWINITSGIMLFIFKRTSDHIPVKIISIEDGKVLKQFNCPHWNREVDIIVSNEKLVVKHDNVNLQILDLPSFKIKASVRRTEFMTSRFIFLWKKQLFLTLKNQTNFVWNFRGELVTSLEDHFLRHPLWHPDFTNINYITSDQNLIISYCRDDSEDQSMVTNVIGSINVSNILSGKCVAKINAAKALECIDSSQTISVTEALEGITTLYYDEDRNAIYTGNRLGHVHVWSNSNKLMIKKK
jgi:hypothetical protein